jgi:hypothetical protein
MGNGRLSSGKEVFSIPLIVKIRKSAYLNKPNRPILKIMAIIKTIFRLLESSFIDKVNKKLISPEKIIKKT